jgi:hypothetical protein
MPLTQAPVNVNTAGFTQIIAVTRCNMVTVRESNQAASTDYLVATPLVSSGPATMPAGSSFPFTQPGPNNNLGAQFLPGQTLGFLKAVTGSVNFDVIEQ